jgi:hypothetical protein
LRSWAQLRNKTIKKGSNAGSKINNLREELDLGTTWEPKYDKKCLDDAGRVYISCIASAGKDLKAQDKCDKEEVEPRKNANSEVVRGRSWRG